ncbi:MAG: hypothetical protein HOD43_06730 [Candidatus Marinimicrobia bacterium]|nr:hypothetical protein [Candidatus Neomarinimicrobiota bacterium]MBT3630064.1 hypothetical protein [Candidatus Neomarinimicrobiota bacterium]MBT3824231.1 hypothetical protein [Candidatus Neomarinimicrobiota bacterium]MBT4131683.1 hypothetical protein [Candidatus Neomarinimicrobiota bacterium]MBT4295487.1 hypothetical protein [Candidatus Neomarinimicrobiota bacterium]
MKSRYLILLFGLLQLSRADVLHIDPYAQWTFDTPLEQVIYRSHTSGFPIMYTLTKDKISYYDSLGNNVIKIARSQNDVFKINADHSHFMLIQENESIQASNPQRIYSFQVYDFLGSPEYTLVHGVSLGGGELNSTLTNQGSIILYQDDEPWILELSNEDTLLFLESVIPTDQDDCEIKLVLDQLVNRNEFITASSCISNTEADSSAFIDLHLWNHNKLLAEPVNIQGRLVGLEAIPATDYYFLEIYDGYESGLTLFNREKIMGHFPWKTWEINSLGREAAFVISENDFNVVNLGDGSVISSYHPIDMSTISDADYLPRWGLFLYIRYEPYFTEDGVQAYRKFELEGVSKTGQIAHRSSFGSWTTTLPKLSQIGKDLFAIHMHNAVLLYRVELEEE